MHFEKGYIYHIYNQGNNRQLTYFNLENHVYFLRKVRTYILPYADILAWCLMPNHFHFMVLVNELEVEVEVRVRSTIGVAQKPTDSVALSDTIGNKKARTFNDSIGLMLRSYTNAVNKKHKRSGKLFREGTPAECVNCIHGIAPSFFNTTAGTSTNTTNPEEQYPELCFSVYSSKSGKSKAG